MSVRLSRGAVSIEYRIDLVDSEDYCDVKFNPEDDSTFPTVKIDGCTVQIAELDGLIESLIKIRDDIRQLTRNDAGMPTGGQGTAASV